MLEIGWAEIVFVITGILTPLLATIKILYDGKEAERLRAIAQDQARVTEYNAMRDRMQDKIDSANSKAGDAISTVTAALSGMSQAMSQLGKERDENFERLKDDIIDSIRETIRERRS